MGREKDLGSDLKQTPGLAQQVLGTIRGAFPSQWFLNMHKKDILQRQLGKLLLLVKAPLCARNFIYLIKDGCNAWRYQDYVQYTCYR